MKPINTNAFHIGTDGDEMTLKFGCQTYTWQMSYDRYVGKIPHILDVIRRAGFRGFEPQVNMLGEYNRDPGLLRQELDEHQLTLGAIGLTQAWLRPHLTEDEQTEAHRVVEYLKAFSGAKLILGHAPGKDRKNLEQRQRNAIAGINEVARIAMDNGIPCAFHPNSPGGSVFRDQEDYEVLFEGLDSSVCGYAPDSGHITNGGMDAVEIFNTYRTLIRHIHFKDITANGEWTVMGQGVIDHPAIVRMLRDTGYDGWVMVEEESKRAESQPDEVTLENGHYVHKWLAALASGVRQKDEAE